MLGNQCHRAKNLLHWVSLAARKTNNQTSLARAVSLVIGANPAATYPRFGTIVDPGFVNEDIIWVFNTLNLIGFVSSSDPPRQKGYDLKRSRFFLQEYSDTNSNNVTPAGGYVNQKG
jgi:hypothetical protein